jgi:TPR repeat protein
MQTCLDNRSLCRILAVAALGAAGLFGQESSPAPAVNAKQMKAILKSAQRSYDHQQYAQALPLFLKAANAGNGVGMRCLGVMYATGRGVAKDNSQAAVWYRKAADAGDADGMSNLGVMYEKSLGSVALILDIDLKLREQPAVADEVSIL